MRRSESETVRRPVIAGSWYPGRKEELAQTVDRYLAQVDQPLLPGELLGLIVPHAGYAYSGQTAAYAYRQLEGRQVETVILIGPSHRAWVGDQAASVEAAYETPLGRVPVNHEFISDLAGQVSLPAVRRDAEHSLEIQLPFLQRQLGEFRLVPILMNADDPGVARRLASALVDVIRRGSGGTGRVLLVASSDLHHIDSYEEVVRRDRPVVQAVADYDLETLTSLLMAPGCSVCGRMPILTVMHAAKALGVDVAEVLYHTNSGDVTGQHTPGQYTVGYMAAALHTSEIPE